MSEQNPNLVDIPVDAVTSPSPTIGTFPGNIHDDDGSALDDYFAVPSQAPVISEGLSVAKESVPIPTRMLRGRIVLTNTPTGNAVQVLPQDINRTYLRVYNTAGENFYIGGDSFNASNLTDAGGAAAFLVTGTNPGFVELYNHTGQLWASPQTVGDECVVEWLAVTC